MIDFDDAPESGGKPFGDGVSRYARAPAPPRGRPLAPGEIPPYVESLNPPQREAVEHTEGPLIVLAGAGSGKTKMLTSRIAYLMDVKGVPAHQILAVTFTNKAAREMRERVERHLTHSSYFGTPEIGTFHSICVRILRRELQATPFTKPFVIYDDSDQLSLIKRTMEKLGVDEKAFSAKAMRAAIDRLKCDALEPADIEPQAYDRFERELKRVYAQYQQDLFANNALDFSEILCMTYRIFRDVPLLREKYQRRYRYIHVDEYQDTNRAQYLLLSTLAQKKHGGHENICVVGDEDQSIYKWRGADIRNIMDFEQDYPGAKVVKLEQNYRSTQTIITAASQLIRNNRERKDKTLWTENLPGPLITKAALADERAEADFVVGEIKRIAANEDRAFQDFAVFYRTHAQSRQFEEAFRREKIPYEIVGGLRFFDRKEIKDILSYFKVLQNPQDSVGLKRIINTPARGIGKTTIDKLEAIQLEREQARARGELAAPGGGSAGAAAGPASAGADGAMDFSGAAVGGPAGSPANGGLGAPSAAPDTSLWEALRLAATDSSYGMNAGTQKKLQAFYRFMEKLREHQPTMKLSELYHRILDETAYVQELRNEATEESLARIENLEEFDTVLQEFEEIQLEDIPEAEHAAKYKDLLPIFLEESALATDVAGPGAHEASGNFISMMSLHSSKGLEFPVVFLVGMEEGLFPSIRAQEEASEEDVEEERRLCYVGITRAREVLYLTHTGLRRIWGEINYQEPARFFQEIPTDLLEVKDLSYGAGASQFRQGSSRYFDRDRFESRRETTNWDDEVSQVPRAPGAKTIVNGAPSKVGKKIQHPDYGIGKIIAQEGVGKDEKVAVQFTRGGTRKFLTRFVEGFIEE